MAWQRCRPGLVARQHVGEKNTLIDLDAILVALQQFGLGGNLCRRWC